LEGEREGGREDIHDETESDKEEGVEGERGGWEVVGVTRREGKVSIPSFLLVRVSDESGK
jgi:hypothetical protein